MTHPDPIKIDHWHAHVYFAPENRDLAWAFRQTVGEQFGDRVAFGRFNEALVGPHPTWSYEISFYRNDFHEIVEWLILNHGTLDLLLHPYTEDGLRDHRDAAVWIGRSYELNLQVFGEPA